MKSMLRELIVNGATIKLEELNKEREKLIKLIDSYSINSVPRLVKEKKKKKFHWAQTPEGRLKIAKAMRRRWKRNGDLRKMSNK